MGRLDAEHTMDWYGALVGWTHEDLGDRVLLRVQSMQPSAQAEAHEPDTLRLLMSKEQAALLGNKLMQIAGETPPSRREGSWFRRMFG